jgi:hypothetical protein
LFLFALFEQQQKKMSKKYVKGKGKRNNAKSYAAKGGRYGNEEYTKVAVAIFTPAERDEMHANARLGFKQAIIDKFQKRQYMKPEDIVDECRTYYKRRYHDHREKGVVRVSSWLNSASSALTGIKAHLKDHAQAGYTFRRKICLTKTELLRLDRLNHARLEENAHDLTRVNVLEALQVGLTLLESEDPAELLVGIAMVTGRRQAEITHTMVLEPPRFPEKHRYPSFWAYCTGFLKQRQGDRYAVRAREVPLLAPREKVVRAIENLRDMWPSDNHKQATSLYGSRAARCMKKNLGPHGVGKLHDLRKFFALTACKHFNERNMALTAFSSFVLGHKSRVSKKILTYLSINLHSDPGLQWLFDRHGCGLLHTQPEDDRLGKVAAEIRTPVNTDSEDEATGYDSDMGPPLRQVPYQGIPAAAAGKQQAGPASDPISAAAAIAAAFQKQV